MAEHLRHDLRITAAGRGPLMPRMVLSPNYRKLFLGSGMAVLLVGTTMLRGTTHDVFGPVVVLLGLFWMCIGALNPQHG
jgi:hypothetical protein